MKQFLMIITCLVVAAACKPGSGGGGGNGAGGAGGEGGGSGTGITCESFKSFSKGCFSQFCAGQGSEKPFCGCYMQGKDIDSQSCQCVALDLDAVCAQIDLTAIDPSTLSCQPIFDTLQGTCSL